MTFEPLEDRRLLATITFKQLLPGGAEIHQIVGEAQPMTGSIVPSAVEQGSAFDIQLQKSPGLLANPAASAAFDLAAEFWESVFFDPVVVIVDADYDALPAGVLGSTLSSTVSGEYDQLRSLLIADAQVGETLPGQLPTQAQLDVLFPPDDADGAFSLSGARSNRAVLKALGVPETSLPDDPSEFNPTVNKDMSMTFSSEFPFDFDPTNGITPGMYDFVGVAIHEIGHGLGFVSSADQVDVALQFPGQVSRNIPIGPLDAFRLRPGAGSTDFTNSPRVLTTAGNAVIYDGVYNPQGFNIPGLTLGDVPLSTGRYTGDGNQASHWKADDITGVTIGIMDPTIAAGQTAAVTAEDLRAFGLIGWDLVETFPTVEVNVAGQAVIEGDAGLTDLVFTVSVEGEVTQDFTVEYATADGGATAQVDYLPTSGVLSFVVDGPTTQTITVSVIGDLDAETNETFLLELSNPTDPAELGTGVAIGQILNDDIDLSIGDVAIVEGHVGIKNAVFKVSAFGSVNETTTVSYTTLNDSAMAGEDYLPRAGVLSFPPGAIAALVTVPVVGDVLNEGDHSFLVFLHSAAGARVTDEIGVGLIIDDDPLPALYVDDVQITTNSAGSHTAQFVVALDVASGRDVTINYSTADGGAKAGVDYFSQTGSLTFAPGVTSRVVSVPVMTYDAYSPNKRFYLKLTDATFALMADPQGTATIVYADAPASELIVDNGDTGYSRSLNGWATVSNTEAYALDYDHHTGGNGNASASWTFDGIASGTYEVFTRWAPFGSYATNAPYTVLDGATPLSTVLVNQQEAPLGEWSNGVSWQSLGTYQIDSNTLAVRLANNANGFVIADAVRIAVDGFAPQGPEMDVAALDVSVGTGDMTPGFADGTDFGEVKATSGSLSRTFFITNNGNTDLHLSGSPRVTIGGAAAADFTVVTQPAAVVAPGAQTAFQVKFDPSAEGARTAIVSIANDDANEGPYTFMIRGIGGEPPDNVFIVDDSSLGFSVQGDWTTSDTAEAYLGQVHAIAPGDGSEQAVWEITGMAPGYYEVYTTWVPSPEAATNAPYTVTNLSGNEYTIFINQQMAPAIPVGSSRVGGLGLIEATGGVVRVSLSNDANGLVLADAVALVRQGFVPDILMQPPPPAAPAHNAAMPQDVNGDNRVTPHDALIVINRLATDSSSPSAAPLAATSGAGAATPYYLDVNADGRVTPHDVLMVINYLLRPPAVVPSTAASPLAASTGAASPLLAAVAVDRAIHALSVTSESSPFGTPPPVEADLASDVGQARPPAALPNAPAVEASFEIDEPLDEATAEIDLAFLNDPTL